MAQTSRAALQQLCPGPLSDMTDSQGDVNQSVIAHALQSWEVDVTKRWLIFKYEPSLNIRRYAPLWIFFFFFQAKLSEAQNANRKILNKARSVKAVPVAAHSGIFHLLHCANNQKYN